MTSDEKYVMNLLAEVHMTILNDWHLRANVEELASAMHTLQSFVKQRVLHRIDPEYWSNWYEDE